MCNHFRVQIQADLSVLCLDCAKTAPSKAYSSAFVQGANAASVWVSPATGKLVA